VGYVNSEKQLLEGWRRGFQLRKVNYVSVDERRGNVQMRMRPRSRLELPAAKECSSTALKFHIVVRDD
jgi:hypothetical protein